MEKRMVKNNKPRACIVTGYGINADAELHQAFNLSGAAAVRVHLQELISDPSIFKQFQILAFPGGFSFGDHLGSGLVVAGIVKKHLSSSIKGFLEEGKPVLGICNGFQILVKAGILPNLAQQGNQEVSLIHNESGTFLDTWIKVEFNKASFCIWTRGLESMELPIRHGEGRFVAPKTVIEELCHRNLVALTYKDSNPNGSEDSIAGITDPSGLILGLMPHPEAFMFPHNHPRWTREEINEGKGLRIIKNGVNYVKEKFGYGRD